MSDPFRTPAERRETGGEAPAKSEETRGGAERNRGGSDDGRGLLRRPGDWSVAAHTISNMKPVQLAGILERRLRHAVVPRLPIDFDERYDRRVPDDLSVSPAPIRANLDRLRESLSETERADYRSAADEAADGRYTFLDRTIDFGDRIDWEREEIDEQPIFWRLKLASFEGFERLVLGHESSSGLDDVRSRLEAQAYDWDASNPIGEEAYLRRSWTPHSVSLRILGWSRYVAWCDGDEEAEVPDRLVRMTYRNALFLANHVEREIGGNHLIENAAALIAAGVLFRDHDTGWVRSGRNLLKRAGSEQFLADGGHFERSPMYHVTVLRRYATATDLLSAVGLPTIAVGTVAEHAMGFLSSLVEPSGEIPLLNDSVRGEAIRAASCLAYCRVCSLTPTVRSRRHPEGSGYRTLSAGDGTLLFDVGDVGPPHLPAHSHNDQLGVLLWIGGRQVLADTGVYDYGANARRQYARSAAAHNTAQYDGLEPIRTGGSYMLGKRTSVTVEVDEGDRIAASHARNSFRGPSYEHRRSVATRATASGKGSGTASRRGSGTASGKGSGSPSGWRIIDRVTGAPDATYTVRYHFHPDVDVCGSPVTPPDAASDADPDPASEPRSGTDGLAIRADGERLASIRFPGTERVRLTESPYFPEYGRERLRSMIAVTKPTGEEVRTLLSVDSDGG
ncbi:alginate lyase family protein [Halorubrum amylolyticum]|uniref:alginate lyase family protein n=1 Tax=Halorubrum amylolyticum TaxID=2508724 RepID=UPI001008ACC7|nr:alginate lyase family protein [Halorubrum amylolyticum]